MASTLKEIQELDWYKERPKVIQEAINTLPPIAMMRFKSSKKECYILSWEEPKSGLLEDITVTVQKTGMGGSLQKSFSPGKPLALDTNKVFGVHLDDLEYVPDSSPTKQ